MTGWALLLRAVNVGGNNKVPMADLRDLLGDLGHTEVRTYLNSGNATFDSDRSDARALADEVEAGLLQRLGVDVRATVLSRDAVAALVEAVPSDVEGYVLVCVLFDQPAPDAVEALETWGPETVRGGAGCLYLAYENVQGSKLTTALIEKRLGVGATARTPATLRKLL